MRRHVFMFDLTTSRYAAIPQSLHSSLDLFNIHMRLVDIVLVLVVITRKVADAEEEEEDEDEDCEKKFKELDFVEYRPVSRLLHDLFCLNDYNHLARPVANDNEPVPLSFIVRLQQIVDLDEKSQVLVTNLWLDLKWKDINLVWDPVDYGGVRDFRVPPDKIWTPELVLQNSASKEFGSTFKSNVVVYSDGSCSFIPPGIFQSRCDIDITWFPFDDQTCVLTFSSRTYTLNDVNVTLMKEWADNSTFITNGEWELLDIPMYRHEVHYRDSSAAFVAISFHLKMRRRTLYYFTNLISPCLLIASMAVLGFYFPPETGEKLTLEITILMSLTFYMQAVSDVQPPSSATPLIAIYFACIMIMVANSVVCTLLILSLHHRIADGPMPDTFRLLFLEWLPWLLRMSRPGTDLSARAIRMRRRWRRKEQQQERITDLPLNFNEVQHVAHNPELEAILRELRVITAKIQSEDDATIVESDWKFAAMVLDRVCLVASLSLTVFLSAAVLLAAPHIIVW